MSILSSSQLKSSQLLHHCDAITICNFKQIYCKLIELQTKITNDIFQLNITQRQELWWNFIELWIELSRKTVDISIDEQYIVTNCYNIITFLCSQVIFDLADTKFVEKTFSACLTMLNLPHMTRFLSKIDKSFDELILSSNIHLILSMAIQSARFLSFDTSILLNKQTDLFILLINYTEKRIEQHSESLIERILTFFWSISDRTCFVPLLIEIGLSKNIVHWLSSSITRTISKYWMALISIIHNLSRHDEGVDTLNKYETIEIIKYFQYKYINEEISLLISMILAQLSSPKQHKRDKKIMNNVLNQLLQRTINAARNETVWRDTGFHISEFLSVMVKLFVVEERTLDYILCHAETEPSSDLSSTIHLFSSLLLSFGNALNKNNQLEQFTLISILNILWSISFQTQYLQEMIINNKEAILLVENLADNNNNNNKVQVIVQYKSRSMEGIHEAAYGIIHNIQKYSQSILNNNSQNLFPKKKPSIMISYSHDDKIICKKLVDFLLTQQDVFDVWIDQIHCQNAGDIWEMIANGMEQANIIVCLISNYYFQSKSCRQEFIYATDTLHKLVVPVLIENFKSKGWLGKIE